MKDMRCFCIFAAGAFFAAAPAAPAGTLDRIVLVVNNSVITELQVEDAIASYVPRLRSVYGSDPTNFIAKVTKLQEDELEALERSKLILDDFAKGAYSTNWLDDELNKALKQDLKESYSGSQTKLTLTLQAEGRTKEEYRKQMRENVIVGALSQLHSTGKFIISPAAIEKYYNDHLDDFKVEDQIKLRTIRIAPPADGPPGAAKELAGEIIRKIDGGISFADMAKECSSDEYRSAGGNWGRWVERKELVPALGNVAFSLQSGKRGPVVEVPDERSGATVCYLLMVDEARPAHVSPLSEVAGAVERMLKAQRGNLLLDQWIKRLEAKSHVENF